MIRRDWGPTPAEQLEVREAVLEIEAARAKQSRGRQREPFIPRRKPRAAVIAGPCGSFRFDEWQADPRD